MMILLTVVGFVDRIAFSWLSERIGRRKSGGLLGLGAGALVILARVPLRRDSVRSVGFLADPSGGHVLRRRRFRNRRPVRGRSVACTFADESR